jgi:two-component system, OmpR family, sensor kinase
MSITSRMIGSLLALIILFWGAAVMTARTALIHEIDEVVSENLSSMARRMMPFVTHTIAGLPQRGFGHDGEDDDDDGGHDLADEMETITGREDGYLSYIVRAEDGRILLRSRDAAAFDIPARLAPGFVTTPEVIAFTRTDRRTGLTLTLLEPGTHRAEAIAEATRSLILPMLLLLPVMAGAILLVVRLSLRPINGLRRQIAERGGANLAPLDSASQPPELRPIARSVDRLMARLSTAMDAERVFAASSAHELRTPIAGALAQIQRLKDEVGTGKAAERVTEVEGTLRRLADFTEKLLQLSRADAGLGQVAERQNLSPVLQAVVQDFTGRSANPLQVDVVNELGGDLMLGMDQDAFAITLRNLLENAGLHGQPGAPVRLVIGRDWTIRVISRGPVVPPDVLVGLKTRYTRGSTKSGGAGLGLAIAEKIMTQSGGALMLLSPATGADDGFEAVMTLP